MAGAEGLIASHASPKSLATAWATKSRLLHAGATAYWGMEVETIRMASQAGRSVPPSITGVGWR